MRSSTINAAMWEGFLASEAWQEGVSVYREEGELRIVNAE